MGSALRNPRINYGDGWFFVTTQVARNKTIFGAVTGAGCVLNELGERVAATWRSLFDYHAEARPDAYVVMPNHFHAVIRILPSAANRPDQLSCLMRIFKSLAAREYRLLKEAGRAQDIGASLWQSSFYDEIITSHDALEQVRRYIAANPSKWDGDRFGPVTTYHMGNLDLLQEPLVAYVASEGPMWPMGQRPMATRWVPAAAAPQSAAAGLVTPPVAAGLVAPGRRPGGPGGRGVISTFTSPQERAILAECLARGRPFVRVAPGGLPDPVPPAIAAACAAGRGLLLSPVPAGTGINKQRAIWCNRYVLEAAAEVWCGTIRPGGTLETLLRAAKLTPEGARAAKG